MRMENKKIEIPLNEEELQELLRGKVFNWNKTYPIAQNLWRNKR